MLAAELDVRDRSARKAAEGSELALTQFLGSACLMDTPTEREVEGIGVCGTAHEGIVGGRGPVCNKKKRSVYYHT